jgi:hypothetical protein
MNKTTTQCQSTTLVPLISSGYGANQLSGTTAACSTTNCIDCIADYQTCITCNTVLNLVLESNQCVCDYANGYYKDPVINTCVGLPTLLNSGKGANNLTKQVAPCIDSNCQDCMFDYSSCAACMTELGYLLNGTVCVHLNNILHGFGADSSTGTVRQCSEIGCLQCQLNSTGCTQCDSGLGLILTDNICVAPSTRTNSTMTEPPSTPVPLIVSQPTKVLNIQASFSPRKSTAELRFSSSLGQLSKISEPLTLDVVDLLTQTNYSCKDLGCTIQALHSDGFTLAFDSKISMIKGELLIYQSADMHLVFQDSTTWSDWPLRVPDISFILKDSVISISTSTAAALNTARLPLSLTMSFSAPSAASFLDSLFSTLILLKMVEGPYLGYPESVLSAIHEIKIIPIELGNPFRPWLDKNPKACLPSTQLAKHEVSCNILSNAGEQLLQIPALLILSIIIGFLANCLARKLLNKMIKKRGLVVSSFINKKEFRKENMNNQFKKIASPRRRKNQPHKASSKNPNGNGDTEDTSKKNQRLSNLNQQSTRATKLLRIIGTALGIQFFIIKMEGNQIELSLLSLVGLKYVTGYSADVVGGVIGLVLLSYYTAVAIMSVRCAIWIWLQMRLLKTVELTASQQQSLKKKPLGHLIDLRYLPHTSLNLCFEDMRAPSRFWHLLLPLVVACRTLFSSIFAIFIVGNPYLQIALMTAIEICTLGFHLAARPRFNWAEQASEISLHFFTTCFLVMKLVSVSSALDEDSKQKKLGLAMAVALICLIIVGGIFAIITIGYMIVGGVKTLIAKYKAVSQLRKIGNKNESAIVSPDNIFKKLHVGKPPLNQVKPDQAESLAPSTSRRILVSKRNMMTIKKDEDIKDSQILSLAHKDHKTPLNITPGDETTNRSGNLAVAARSYRAANNLKMKNAISSGMRRFMHDSKMPPDAKDKNARIDMLDRSLRNRMKINK